MSTNICKTHFQIGMLNYSNLVYYRHLIMLYNHIAVSDAFLYTTVLLKPIKAKILWFKYSF